MDKPAIIQTEELVKVYGMGDVQVRALDGITLRIAENEFVAIMGASGSGKSTLMNILGCLDRPTSGKYYLAGEDVSNLSRTQLAVIRNQRLGFVFQSYNLLPRTSALDNVMLPLFYNRNGKINDRRVKDKALESLAAVGLADRVRHQPQEMSGGQMQRVAIARALINDPVLILADEPTGNLDTRTGEEIMEIFEQLHEQGNTIILVTHEEYIAEHTNRIIRLRDGKIERDESI